MRQRGVHAFGAAGGPLSLARAEGLLGRRGLRVQAILCLVQLAAVLLVAESHAPVLIRQRVEELSDALGVADFSRELTLCDKLLDLLLLLASDLVESAAVGTDQVADLIHDILPVVRRVVDVVG